MATMSATDAKNKIGELWDLAEQEPVTIERNGVAKYQLISTDKYIALPKHEYERLRSVKRVPRRGFAREALKDLDVEALLAVDISAEFEDYL
jgi:PHD/YefM family antitoxin component YafN of YafNO toxin-antitoxin module